MATHTSTIAWKIPWTEEPGRLQSMGSQSQTRLSDFTFFLSFMAPQGSKINLRIKQASEDELKEGKKMQETPVQSLGREDPLEKG